MKIMIKRNGKLIGNKFMEFYFPSILMAASASISLIVDSIIVGNMLGEDALAAVNLLMPISLCFTATTALFGIGSASCIAALKGKMDHENANKSLTLTFIGWGVLSLLMVIIGLFANQPLTSFLSGASGLNQLVYDYLKVYMIGSPFTFATLIFPHIIKADGKPKLASNALIVANFTNLLLDVVYMGPLKLGIAGGALATVTGNLVGTLILASYIFSKTRNIFVQKVGAQDVRLYVDMFKMSVASIFGQGLMFGKIWIFNMLIAKVSGQAGLSAFSVCTSCLSFVSMFIAGGAQTMIPMVSAFEGAKDDTAIEITVKKAMKIILGCCIIVTIIFNFVPNVVMNIYGISGGEAFEIGVKAVRIFSMAFVGIGFSFTYMYYMQAKKNAVFSMQICALEGFFVIVPMGIVLSLLLGINGLWLAYSVNEILVALFIVAKARGIVKKSEGTKHGLFMLHKPAEESIEMSVDVRNPGQVEEAMRLINEPVLRDMIELSKYAYEQKNKKSAWIDIIVKDGKIYLKDMGMDYRMLRDTQYLDKLKSKNQEYENSMLIGMNYSSIAIQCKER